MGPLVKICEGCGEKNEASRDSCIKCGESLVFVYAKEEQGPASEAKAPGEHIVRKMYRRCYECGFKNYVKDVYEHLNCCKNPECKNEDIMKQPVEVEGEVAAGVRPAAKETATLYLVSSKSGCIADDDEDYEIEFPGEGAVIGKRGDIDRGYFERFTYVSKYHCRVYFKNDSWYIKDLGSQNGTYLQGSEKPLKPYTEHRLRDGGTVRLGDVQFIIKVR